MASALGVAVAIALAGVTMLLAAPAYAGEGSLLLERRGVMAEAKRLCAEVESQEDGEAVMTRVVEVYHNPFEERWPGFTFTACRTTWRSNGLASPQRALNRTTRC